MTVIMRKPSLKGSSLFGLLFLSLLLVSAVSAHPVDETVHTSYLTLTGDTVLVDVDITPGVVVAAQVLPLIDTDGSGDISESEGQSYASTVVAALRLNASDTPLALTLNSVEYPPYADLSAGTGVIRLHLSAPLPGTASGDYALFYENTYEIPGIRNVYLTNGFVAAGERDRFDITNQQRDYEQHTLLLSYSLFSAAAAVPQTQSTWNTVSVPVLIAQSMEELHEVIEDFEVSHLIRTLAFEFVRASQ